MLKNIIVVCDFAYIEGGASRVAHESAMALSELYNVVLFAAVGPVSKELSESKVKVVCLNQKDILHNSNRVGAVVQGIWNNKAKAMFEDLLKRYNPRETIIHVHTWTKGISSSIFRVAEQRRFRVCLTVHDYFLACPNGGLFDYQNHCICECKPMSAACLCKNCDSRSYFHKLFRVVRQAVQNNSIRHRKNISYIFISNFAEKQLLRRLSGITTKYFLQNPINFTNRFKVDCAENSHFTYIARLTDDKGVRIFCKAVTEARVPAYVIGTGVLENELKLQYPNIKFTGWLSKEQMVPYLKNTRAYIFSSIYYEASPLTPLEMMACGIPCIVSDKNSSAELIVPGVNGFLYDGYSAETLENVIRKCSDSKLIEEMSNRIFHDFDSSKYSMKRHIEGLTTIYNTILNS